MNFLPIAERELRVAARKRSTFRVRIGAAVTGLLLGTGCLILGNQARAGSASMGSTLFAIVSWLCLATGLAAGLFFTSDALSEEKREGTLGLLFLTDLRGYDVALGKLMATSLRGFYAFLAVLPVLAVTLVMGGITGPQYWKTCLALVNGLFLSLSAGMLISALSRDSQKALALTLLVVLLLSLGGPLFDTIIAEANKAGFRPVWSLSSPGFVLANADAWRRSAFWPALVINQVVGWSMLLGACLAVPYTWQERRRAGVGAARGWAYALRYGGRRRGQRQRGRLLERQPVVWLACRERWQSLGLWLIAVLVAGWLLFEVFTYKRVELWMMWTYLGGFLTLLLYLCTASLACRFPVEARRSGLLELLLVSPLKAEQIVRGQWRAFLRMFGLPVLLLLGAQATGATLAQLSWLGMMNQASTASSPTAPSPSGPSTNQAGAVGSSNTYTSSTGSTTVVVGFSSSTGTFTGKSPPHRIATAVVAAASAGLRTGANLVALIWFGLWAGLTTRSANLATLRTILFVQVIPWFLISFGTTFVLGLLFATLLQGGGGPPAWWVSWWPLASAVVGTALAVTKDIVFVAWSRNRLYSNFREQAAKGQ